MSLHFSARVHAPQPLAWFSRYYQGPLVTLNYGGRSLRLTVNHPVLTHVGWRPARLVERGFFLVHAAVAELSVSEVADEALTHLPSVRLDGHGRDFWGDGDRFDTFVAVVDASMPFQRPLRGGEGDPPPVDAGTVREVLAGLSTPAGFGCATWEAALRTVPRLGLQWPAGAPTRRATGVSAVQQVRLGSAVTELPEPPVDTEALAERLLGVRVALSLVRVEGVEKASGGAVVYDVDTTAGCCAANGAVVG